MSIDEMKAKWNQENATGSYDEATIKKIVKSRVRKHTGTAFQYFWAAFVLQILVYSLLSHVIVKYWYDPSMTLPGLLGISAFIPFTIVMMRRFKDVAFLNNSEGSMKTYVVRRQELLERFYEFKKKYELILIPLATFIGTFLVFELYVPGGIWVYPKGAAITFLISLTSCIIAIREENRRNFEEPIGKLKGIVGELD